MTKNDRKIEKKNLALFLKGAELKVVNGVSP
ncbi:Protein CBG25283 [Caenorhabditis briggsae]|uniref:Protein CBG25283 n=1 Tax=Caenorhabditis briggsae TaxID=6238 RepID=B6IIK1_CAEBR|nr:Protein CBG25283 [Caenorhabditis briggsae]CAR99731.1 Protein CBG25283 [Caenorhabditis briggsae]